MSDRLSQYPELLLEARAGLPDALRVLLDDYPREAWRAHPAFSELIAFWLDRHQMFRRLVGLMEEDVQAVLSGQQEMRAYQGRLSHLGGLLVNQLHGHHQIEDLHYFPLLRGLEGRIELGFDLLESDHERIDPLLNDFATAANAVLNASDDRVARDLAGAFGAELGRLMGLLHRHLEDEEELIVPVLLKNPGAGPQ